MNLGNGWDLTPAQTRQLTTLAWLYDATDGTTNRYAALDPLTEHRGEDQVGTVFASLRRDGLVAEPVTIEESPAPVRSSLTEAGATTVEELRCRRADPATRRPAARDALLRWLYERTVAGEPTPALSSFHLWGHAAFLGDRFTKPEIDEASRWLKERGYLRGPGSWGGGVLRPTITAAGERLVEQHGSVNEPDTPGSIQNVTYNVTDSHGVNVAHASPGAQQTATVTITSDQRRRVTDVADYLDYLRHAPADLPGELVDRDADLADLAVRLRTEARKAVAHRGTLGRLLDSARELALLAASVPFGAGLLALVDQARKAIGL
ncbi:MAG: hypothetical protein ACRDN9_17070 [Streptosporangiaceae bacterium]